MTKDEAKEKYLRAIKERQPLVIAKFKGLGTPDTLRRIAELDTLLDGLHRHVYPEHHANLERWLKEIPSCPQK